MHLGHNRPFVQLGVVLDKMTWTDHVGNEVSHIAKEEKNILHAIQRRQASWIEHILHRNCPVQQVIEGKIGGGTEVMGRQKQDVSSYWMILRKWEDTGSYKRKH
jgi:hypothetical protein